MEAASPGLGCIKRCSVRVLDRQPIDVQTFGFVEHGRDVELLQIEDRQQIVEGPCSSPRPLSSRLPSRSVRRPASVGRTCTRQRTLACPPAADGPGSGPARCLFSTFETGSRPAHGGRAGPNSRRRTKEGGHTAVAGHSARVSPGSRAVGFAVSGVDTRG